MEAKDHFPQRIKFAKRQCLNKACSKMYIPSRWNQRYCQAPECRKEVRRWQAARRQQKAREKLTNRHKHAEAERRRREKQKARRRTPPTSQAWSRSKENVQKICGRPGCWEAPRIGSKTKACYCGHACGFQMRRVRDRERNYRKRHTVTKPAESHISFEPFMPPRSRARLGSGSFPNPASAAFP